MSSLNDLEQRLLALKQKMESGLAERAKALRELSARVEAGDIVARKALKTESHKLRGVAGTYGHQELTDKAAELEQRASLSPMIAPSEPTSMRSRNARLARRIAPSRVR